MLRLIIPTVLKTTRRLSLPGIIVAKTPGREYLILASFREDRPGGRVLELVAAGNPRGIEISGLICIAGWAGAARLVGAESLLNNIKAHIPVDKAYLPPSSLVFLIAEPESLRPILHPAECHEALLPYIRGWLNYLGRHPDIGLSSMKKALGSLEARLEYVYEHPRSRASWP